VELAHLERTRTPRDCHPAPIRRPIWNPESTSVASVSRCSYRWSRYRRRNRPHAPESSPPRACRREKTRRCRNRRRRPASPTPRRCDRATPGAMVSAAGSLAARGAAALPVSVAPEPLVPIGAPMAAPFVPARALSAGALTASGKARPRQQAVVVWVQPGRVQLVPKQSGVVPMAPVPGRLDRVRSPQSRRGPMPPLPVPYSAGRRRRRTTTSRSTPQRR
jgi:hypothetical protein